MAQRMPSSETRVAVGVGGVLLGGAITVLGLLVLISTHTSGLWVILFLLPILLAASWPAFLRQARRERDARLAQLLMLALVLKLFGSLVRYWVAIHVYEGVADAIQYHQVGADLARRFAAGHFDTGLSSLSSTDFIRFFTGVIYTVTGPSIYAGFLLYSWLAFWGMFFLYQAFTIAVPDGNRRSYARLLFFLPSMLYWPSSIGKEAWMLFALGLAAKGTARLLTGRTWGGLVLAGTGLWLATLVRPHVGGMAALGLLVAYLLARPPRRLGMLGAVIKLFGLAVLLVVAVVLLGQIQRYLLDKGIDPAEGVNSVLAESARRTSGGGSGFQAPSTSTSLLGLPYATVTILFRPFPFEAHNAQAAVIALESTLLLCLTVARSRTIWRAVRHLRRWPYVAFVVVYTAGFVVAFASISNFGILARERVQLLPFFFVLLAVPGGRRRHGPSAAPAADQQRRVDAGRQLARA
ncbi:MAG TPA: hypothetical protein VK713_03195 [Actinomycetes bacterium]|jgi:hypothetical protein|nr:hypothetical protein [Actinomycetes bacterium]